MSNFLDQQLLENAASDLATVPPLDYKGYCKALEILTGKGKTLEAAVAIIKQYRHGHQHHYMTVDDFLDLTGYGDNKADREQQGGNK